MPDDLREKAETYFDAIEHRYPPCASRPKVPDLSERPCYRTLPDGRYQQLIGPERAPGPIVTDPETFDFDSFHGLEDVP